MSQRPQRPRASQPDRRAGGGRLGGGVLARWAVMGIFLLMVTRGTSVSRLTIGSGFIFTPLMARTVRSAVQVESQLDYLSSARLLGERPLHMMFIEILP